MRVLVVDDEPVLCAQIAGALTSQNYTVEMAGDGEEALERIAVEPYDLVILDVMLPKKDGFAVLQELRLDGLQTPVLMLTARDAIEDRVKGLDLGADDYLHKPFSLAELLARVRMLLRRSHQMSSVVMAVAGVQLNTATRQVTLAGEAVNLTPKEFSLLEFLLYNRNRAISRFNMAEHIWGDAFDPFSMSNTIDVHIRNLRRKLDDQSGVLIKTVRGTGYMLSDNEA